MTGAITLHLYLALRVTRVAAFAGRLASYDDVTNRAGNHLLSMIVPVSDRFCLRHVLSFLIRLRLGGHKQQSPRLLDAYHRQVPRIQQSHLHKK